MHRYLFALLIIVVSCLPAMEKAGVILDEQIIRENTTLKLNGVAVRKKMIFKVYVAGLYLSTRSNRAEDILSRDEPRMMKMIFLRSVEREKLIAAWEEGIKANYPSTDRELDEQIKLFLKANVDVKNKDQLEIFYSPQSGILFSLNGQKLFQASDRRLADALFSCWLGPKPGPGEDFKKDLLQGVK